jgi:hypothetical protein
MTMFAMFRCTDFPRLCAGVSLNYPTILYRSQKFTFELWPFGIQDRQSLSWAHALFSNNNFS